MSFFSLTNTSFSTKLFRTLLVTLVVFLSSVGIMETSTRSAHAQSPADSQSVPATTDSTPSTPPAPSDSANASGCSGTMMNAICQVTASILGLFVDFVGKLVLLVVSVLITFTQYNGFASAPPVETGWVIVRDTTNMFFIIVLLLTAFSTVIGKKEFYYESVLPNLLLQAVLINFSRTIIQLGIDFSQVVMLTFVNAFAQAAAGNFVIALGLDKMLQMANNLPVNLADIIISYLLALSFTMITLGVMIILLCYIVYRIVALWVTLIMAPLAFFVTALPDKIKSGIGKAAGSEFWSRLVQLLTGGPIIAFFLWLTLAITQQSVEQASEQGLSKVLNLQFDNTILGNTAGFLTNIADSAHILSFVIGIAMLLMALDTAIASAAVMGVAFHEAMKKVGGFTKSAAMSAIKSPITGTYGALDKRFDITRKASTGALAVASVIPGLRNAKIGEKGGTVRDYLKSGINYRRKEAKEIQAKDAAFTDDLLKYAESPEEARRLLQLSSFARTEKGLPGIGVTRFSTKGARSSEAYFQEKEAEEKLLNEEYKRDKGNEFDRLYAQNIERGLTREQAREQAKIGSETIAKERTFEKQRKSYAGRYETAKLSGDKREMARLEEEFKKKPHLAPKNEKGQNEYYGKLIDSPELYKEIGEATSNDGAFLTEFMLKNGWVFENGELIERDRKAWDDVKMQVEAEGNHTLLRAMNEHARFAQNTSGLTMEQLNGMRYAIHRSDNTLNPYNVRSNDNVNPKMAAGTRVQTTTQQRALAASKRDAHSSTAINSSSMADALIAGTSLPETLANAGYKNGEDPAVLETFASSYIANETRAAASVNEEEIVRQARALHDQANQDIMLNITDQINEIDARAAKDLQAEIDRITNRAQEEYIASPDERKSIMDQRDQDIETAKQRSATKVAEATQKLNQQITDHQATFNESEVRSNAKAEANLKAEKLLTVLMRARGKGVTHEQSTIILGEFFKNQGGSIINHVQSYTGETKDNILDIANEVAQRRNDILKKKPAERSEGETAILKGVEEFIAEYNKKPKDSRTQYERAIYAKFTSEPKRK